MRIPRITSVIACGCVALFAAVACSSSSTSPEADTSTPAGQVASTVATSPTTAPMDAKAVLDKLTAAGLPISHGAVQDENTDPNDLLGRPNGYVSRASFDLPGGDQDADQYGVDRGGVIEVWPDAAAVQGRVKYIQDALKAAPILGTEWDYQNGTILVRVSGNCKPSLAKKIKAAVDKL